MSRMYGLLSGSVMLLAFSGVASAASFKAEYYPACYGLVSQAREMVAKPPIDVAGKAQKAGDVAGTIGKLGGMGIPGLGGLGALGGLTKAASTASQVATYSNYISDAAKFTTKMQEDYPDAAARVAAYGDKMGQDADKIGSAGMKLDEARGCYGKSLADLKAGFVDKSINAREAAKRQKEIQTGLGLANEVLSDARSTMDTNIKSYNDALNTDTSGMGLNLGSIAQSASLGSAAMKLAGTGAGAKEDMYGAYYSQTNAYTSAWWDAYNKSGDQAAASAAAQAALNGAKSPVQPYQEAYWTAQAAAAAKGTQLEAVSANSIANLGALQSLSSLGGFGGLSGTGLAWVAANRAVGAIGTGGEQSVVPATPAAVAQAANVSQVANTANLMRGMSGGGAAFVGANLALGAIGNATASKAEEPAAPTEVTEGMKSSLLKTSVDSSKFTDAYGMISWQSQEYASLSESAKAKLE
jgi:hypothetical protein